MDLQPIKLYVVQALIAKESNSKSTWYVDSGATQHMCHQLDAFLNHTKYDNDQFGYPEDDSIPYKIEGENDITIKLINGMEKLTPNVLYILGLA